MTALEVRDSDLVGFTATGPELRVTRRCCTEDLGESGPGPTDELTARHPIVKKFAQVRSERPIGSEKIKSVITRADVYSLHLDRYRAATWYDRASEVVWLLGYGIHKAGDRADAYRRFAALDRQARLFPDADDYEAFIEERDARQVRVVLAQVGALVARARVEEGTSQSTMLSNGVRITVRVDLLRDDGDDVAIVEELHLAVAVRNLEVGWLDVLRAAALPEYRAATWEFTKGFPDRGPATNELRFRHWHELTREDI
jgi:hypothetical protein